VQSQPAFEGAHSEFGLVGDSPQIQNVLRIVKKLSRDTSPVLILGESGVGKELVARAVHQVSPIAAKVFLPVDAATLVGSLMESELFGHVRGAFTGAVGHNQGLVRSADGGTLFLDEIGELTPPAQAKLLRLLQEQEVRPVGSAQPVKVNVRILAATNRDLEQVIKDGSFRDDLYYRLKVVTIRVPPLRERKSDILPLARHFVAKYALQPVSVSDTVIERFLDYPWPGNVRELENTIQRAALLSPDQLLTPTDFPVLGEPRSGDEQEQSLEMLIRNKLVSSLSQMDVNELDNLYDMVLHQMERPLIEIVLEKTRGNQVRTAEILGINRNTLRKKIKTLEIDIRKD
jgi:two-component system, NtrC family, nitrogen regulation response regulator GlnG